MNGKPERAGEEERREGKRVKKPAADTSGLTRVDRGGSPNEPRVIKRLTRNGGDPRGKGHQQAGREKKEKKNKNPRKKRVQGDEMAEDAGRRWPLRKWQNGKRC